MTIFEFLFVCFFSLEVSTMERKLTFQAKPWMRFWRVKFHKQNRVSPLHTSLQVVSFQRREHAFPCPIAEVLESGMRCHKWATSASACAFAYFTVLYWVQYYSIFISSPGCLETSIKATWHSWYCTFQGTVLKYWKYFLFCVCFLCIIWVRSIINLS